MSQTTTAQPVVQQPPPQQPPPPQPYDAGWLVPLCNEIGIRRQVRASPVAPVAVQPNRPRLPPAAPGKGRSKLPFEGMMRETLMGAGRTNIDPNNALEIARMQQEGLAAPVGLALPGRNLQGSFFSAEGHNLKTNAGQPDLTRPAVLLLTGSGGSAQDQGLDLAKFYAKSGASVLSVNYGGFGDSTSPGGAPFVPTERSLNEDAQAMLQHLVDLGYDPENIVIHGFSLGGAIGGTLKEQMEGGQLAPQDGSAPTPVKLRGAVMDRPMVSLAHGVTSDMSGAGGKLAAAYSRKALGKFSARKAINTSANTDTRMVVTNDNEDLGPVGAQLRQQLMADAALGNRAAVTGAATGAAHLDTATAIATNGAAFKDLIQNKRDGTAQPVQSGKPNSFYQTMRDLEVLLDGELFNLDQTLQRVTAQLAGFRLTPPTPQQLQMPILTAEGALKKALDLSRFIPASLAPKQAAAKAACITLQDALAELSLMRNRAQATQPAQGGQPPQAPATPSPVLLDAASEQAQAALDALAQGNGPSTANKALEDEVIKQTATVDGIGAPFFAQTLVTDLKTAVTAINQNRQAIRAQAQARRDLRARRRAQAGAVGNRLAQQANRQ